MVHTKSKPALELWIPGPPKTKENKQGFGNGRYYNQKHKDVVEWEIMVNHLAIDKMKELGFTGPYKGRCRIMAAQTYESWKRCDITNYWKSLNDALNGAVWMDDSQVDAASCYRFIDRDNPGVRIWVWFYDIDFTEQFGTGKFAAKTGNEILKYPAKYAIFDLRSYEYRARLEFVTRPEEAPATRYGTYERLKTLEERKKEKGTRSTTKRTQRKRKAVPNDKSQVERPKRTGRQRRSTGNGSTGTTRRSRGSS